MAVSLQQSAADLLLQGIQEETPVALVGEVGESGFFDPHTEKLLADLKSGNRKRKREKSKWGSETAKMFIPGVPPILLADLDGEKISALMTRIRIEEITMRLNSQPIRIDETEERSPSPIPMYDGHGKRTNTRDVRLKNKLARERQLLVDEAKKLNPAFRPPVDFKPISLKKTKKIYIPIKEYPEYNFMGLIIGPRGMTQKQMEKETGAKISIRGKGSVKDGRKRANHPDDEDDLHVLITADSNDQLKKAGLMIERLLIPVEEGKNEHKRKQLFELARINGTLRENNWEHEKSLGLTGPMVACAHCGELSHPSADCPFKNQPGFVNRNIDKEYDAFLEAIGDESAPGEGGQPPPPPGAGLTEEEKQKEYEAFMESLGDEMPGASSGGGGAPWQGGQGGGLQPTPPGAPWQQQQQSPYGPGPGGPPPFPRGPGMGPGMGGMGPGMGGPPMGGRGGYGPPMGGYMGRGGLMGRGGFGGPGMMGGPWGPQRGGMGRGGQN